MRILLPLSAWALVVFLGTPWASAQGAAKSGALGPTPGRSRGVAVHRADAVYAWLCGQQGPHGILGNQEGESFSATYPAALAALCFLHEGEVERAERVFDFFQSHFQECFGSAPGGFYQFWDAARGEGHRDSDRWIGDNAWMLISLNEYRRKTGSARYDTMREGIASWLIGLQDSDGGIKSGFNRNGPMDSKSTEGNLDCLAALESHPRERAGVRKFLETQMWLPKEKRFKMGSTCPDPAMDTSAWGVCALGRTYRGTLRYAEKTFLRSVTAKASGRSLTAFSDFADKPRVWLEGSGEMAVAYRVAGEHAKAEKTLQAMERAMIPSAAFPDTAGMPCHTNDPAWETGAERIFVPSQAWYLFGVWSYNPMAAGDPRLRP